MAERPSRTLYADLIRPYGLPRDHNSLTPNMNRLAAVTFTKVLAQAPVVLFIGGHVIKEGLGPVVAAMINAGRVAHLAVSGSVLVHDFELTAYGGTSECVADNLKDGSFGFWEEHDDLRWACCSTPGRGMARSVGDLLLSHDFDPEGRAVLTSPIVAAANRGIPVTAHPLVGGDVTHPAIQHNEPAGFGEAAFNDFAELAYSLYEMQAKGGVFINVASATTGPEVYLKGLSWARNVLRQEQRARGNQLPRWEPHVTAVFDNKPFGSDGPPAEHTQDYYFRPFKTLLHRGHAGEDDRGYSGRGYYIRGDIRSTLTEFCGMIGAA